MHRPVTPAAKAAGIPEPTYRDLRQPGASLMIAAGRYVKVIAEQMGHSDGGGLVLKRQGPLNEGARPQAATVLEAHVSGPGADRPVGRTGDEGQMGLDPDARENDESPRFAGASSRADDGTRTHDLLHGKQTL